MEQTPRFIRAMLEAHERNTVRRHPTNAVVNALYMFKEEDRQNIMNAWAQISRDEPLPEGSRVGGVRVVKEEDVADWLREHGKTGG